MQKHWEAIFHFLEKLYTLGLTLDLARLNKAGKMLERSVVGCFPFGVKTAPRQLSHLEVIGNAVAAYAFAGARVIGAVASDQVLLLVTFNRFPPFMKSAKAVSISI